MANNRTIWRSNDNKIAHERASGTGALALTITPDMDGASPGESVSSRLTDVRLNITDGAGNQVTNTTSEDFTVKLDSGAGQDFDLPILNVGMAQVYSVEYFPDNPIYFETGDKITATFTNTDANTWAFEIVYEVGS